jgi:hypothetical protein
MLSATTALPTTEAELQIHNPKPNLQRFLKINLKLTFPKWNPLKIKTKV